MNPCLTWAEKKKKKSCFWSEKLTVLSLKRCKFSVAKDVSVRRWLCCRAGGGRESGEGAFAWCSCPLWCRVKWRLYRKYTGGTLQVVISGMKKSTTQERWNKHREVSRSVWNCSAGGPERGKREGEWGEELCCAPAESNAHVLKQEHAAQCLLQ